MHIDYNHYNSAPEGLKELPLLEWQKFFFMYCLKGFESRQVRDRDNNSYFDLRMFDVPNFDNKKLGFAIKSDWFNNGKYEEPTISFCTYGLDEDWNIFRTKFAAQFAND